MQDRVGQQFGNYRLMRRIGHGGYAEVYLAEHIYLPDQQYAIKILTRSNLQEHQREEFLAEARIIANLQRLNDHIVQIRDFGIQSAMTGSDIPYFVMEYASAGTLRSINAQGQRMPPGRIVFYVNQVAEALQCAHDQTPHIIHRDVKPENMLLRTRDHVLLSDFGIAIRGNTTTLQSVLIGDSVEGTAAYIAPERLLTGGAIAASDQYSLAVVVYEWLAGYRPFRGTDREICEQHKMMSPPSLRAKYPDITDETEAVVMRALAKNPKKRYPSVLVFAQELMWAIQQPRPIAPFSPAVSSFAQEEPAEVQRMAHSARYPLPEFVETTEPTMPQLLPPPLLLPDPVSPPEQPSPLLPPSVAQPARPVRWVQPTPSVQPVQPPRWRTPTPSVLPTQPEPSAPLAATSQFSSLFQPSARRRGNFFAFSSQFVYDPRYSLFRNGGFLLNVLASIAIAFLMGNFFVFPAALLYSLLMLLLCICAAEEALASFFGLLVALYWGWFGWLLGSIMAAHSHVDHVLGALVIAALFFVISVGIHIRYALSKNL